MLNVSCEPPCDSSRISHCRSGGGGGAAETMKSNACLNENAASGSTSSRMANEHLARKIARQYQSTGGEGSWLPRPARYPHTRGRVQQVRHNVLHALLLKLCHWLLPRIIPQLQAAQLDQLCGTCQKCIRFPLASPTAHMTFVQCFSPHRGSRGAGQPKTTQKSVSQSTPARENRGMLGWALW
jgi:hypothetical protein